LISIISMLFISWNMVWILIRIVGFSLNVLYLFFVFFVFLGWSILTKIFWVFCVFTSLMHFRFWFRFWFVLRIKLMIFSLVYGRTKDFGSTCSSNGYGLIWLIIFLLKFFFFWYKDMFSKNPLGLFWAILFQRKWVFIKQSLKNN
jgi:hypothetical protein